MPYKNPNRQREYQREWIKNRREEWLQQNGPCVTCQSWEKLEIDHIDPTTKGGHRIWSYQEARRDEELAKCQVLCSRCHKVKTSVQTRERLRRLSDEQVLMIRRNPNHWTDARFAEEYQVHRSTIGSVRRYETFPDLIPDGTGWRHRTCLERYWEARNGCQGSLTNVFHLIVSLKQAD